MTDKPDAPDIDDTDIAADDAGATAAAQRAAQAAKAAEPHDNVPAGSAETIGSTGFDDPGAFDVGDPDPDENERKAPG